MKGNDEFQEIYTRKINDITIRDEVMNLCGDFIEKNPNLFISAAEDSYRMDGIVLEYDYAEIKTMECPELAEVREAKDRYMIIVVFPYILDLWKNKEYLGAIQADCKAEVDIFLKYTQRSGVLSRLSEKTNKVSFDIISLKIMKIDNEDAYFDTYIP